MFYLVIFARKDWWGIKKRRQHERRKIQVTLAELINNLFLLGGNHETRIALEHRLRAVATAWKTESAFLHLRELIVARGAVYVLTTKFGWVHGPPMLARSPLVLTHPKVPKSEILLSARKVGSPVFSGPHPGRTKDAWDEAKALCDAWMIDGVSRATRFAELAQREIPEENLPRWAQGNLVTYLLDDARNAEGIEQIVKLRPALALAFVRKFAPDVFPE